MAKPPLRTITQRSREVEWDGCTVTKRREFSLQEPDQDAKEETNDERDNHENEIAVVALLPPLAEHQNGMSSPVATKTASASGVRSPFLPSDFFPSSMRKLLATISKLRCFSPSFSHSRD